jgi:hypothetical protein
VRDPAPVLDRIRLVEAEVTSDGLVVFGGRLFAEDDQYGVAGRDFNSKNRITLARKATGIMRASRRSK